jgi:quinol monooxygenase YgiN
MFIRVVSYEVKPGMMDEAEQVYHKFTSEALRTQPGFQNGYAIINSHTGIALTVAVWAAKEDFERFIATGAGKALAGQIEPLLANPPIVTEFDRLIQA